MLNDDIELRQAQESAARPLRRPSARTLVRAALLALAAAFFLISLLGDLGHEFAWDFAINWTAGYALRTGAPIYDRAALRAIGVEHASPLLGQAFTYPYNSYIGPPTTALLHLPLTLLPFATALAVYQASIAIAFAAAMLIAWAAAPGGRGGGLMWGCLALLLCYPVRESVWLGQVDAWVMLALAAGLWAWRGERWWLLGAALGVAAMLKVSPAICVVYFVIRGRWRVGAGAALAAACGLAAAALAGGAESLRTFALDVVPALSAASLHAQNQSLPAWLARLASPAADLNDFTAGIGSLSLLSPAVAAAGLALTLWVNRRRADHALTLPLLIVTALLAGPLTWDHYASWALLTLPAAAAPEHWAGRSQRERRNLAAVLLAGGALIAVPAVYFAPGAVAALWWLRLLTGTKTAGLLLWEAAYLWIGLRPRAGDAPSRCSGASGGDARR